MTESATRAAYDAIAPAYIEHFKKAKPPARTLEHAFLVHFAELVRGPVIDVGSGPGWITAVLHGLGVDVRGLDLSERMVELARAAHPQIRFDQGSMTALDVPDGVLGGIVAWYSVIHIEPERRPAVFREFRRALAPGGLLLLGFQVGDEPNRYEEAFGHRVSLAFHRLRPDQVTRELAAAGLTVTARLERDSQAGEPTGQGFLLARADVS